MSSDGCSCKNPLSALPFSAHTPSPVRDAMIERAAARRAAVAYPVNGVTALAAAVDAEADRIRSLAGGCAQMFFSDYMGCRGIDFASFCDRQGMLFTNDASARFQSVRTPGGPTSANGNTARIPGSVRDVLRVADYLDLAERIGPLPRSEADYHPYLSPLESDLDVELTRGYDSYKGEFIGSSDTSSFHLGFGILFEWGAKTGVSGPAVVEVSINLSSFGFASADVGLRPPYAAADGGGIMNGSIMPPAIPPIMYRARFSLGAETQVFVPFTRTVMNKARAVPAWVGAALVPAVLDDPASLTPEGILRDGSMEIIAPDVLTNVRATFIGAGSTRLPEALALLAIGKQVKP